MIGKFLLLLLCLFIFGMVNTNPPALCDLEPNPYDPEKLIAKGYRPYTSPFGKSIKYFLHASCYSTVKIQIGDKTISREMSEMESIIRGASRRVGKCLKSDYREFPTILINCQKNQDGAITFPGKKIPAKDLIKTHNIYTNEIFLRIHNNYSGTALMPELMELLSKDCKKCCYGEYPHDPNRYCDKCLDKKNLIDLITKNKYLVQKKRLQQGIESAQDKALFLLTKLINNPNIECDKDCKTQILMQLHFAPKVQQLFQSIQFPKTIPTIKKVELTEKEIQIIRAKHQKKFDNLMINFIALGRAKSDKEVSDKEKMFWADKFDKKLNAKKEKEEKKRKSAPKPKKVIYDDYTKSFVSHITVAMTGKWQTMKAFLNQPASEVCKTPKDNRYKTRHYFIKQIRQKMARQVHLGLMMEGRRGIDNGYSSAIEQTRFLRIEKNGCN